MPEQVIGLRATVSQPYIMLTLMNVLHSVDPCLVSWRYVQIACADANGHATHAHGGKPSGHIVSQLCACMHCVATSIA